MRPFPVLVALGLATLAGASVLWPHPGAPSGDPLEPQATVVTSMGAFTIGLYEQQVPLTVDHFIRLAGSHAYDGTHVDRIVPGFDVQMGDSTASIAADPVADEFHPGLRHDRAGIVSLARDASDPDSARSSFFVTTAPVPGYDDRYSVFGHVIQGMDVVEAIARAPTSGGAGGAVGTPTSPIAIERVTVRQAGLAPAGAIHHGVALAALAAEKTAAAGGNASFVFVVTNTGNAIDTIGLAGMAPPGWTLALEASRVRLPAGRGWAVLATAAPGDGAQAHGLVHLVAASEADPDATAARDVAVHLGSWGPVPAAGREVGVEFTGVFQDGRLFDTTDAGLASDPSLRAVAGLAVRPAPYMFTLGQAAVSGFDALVARAHLGETAVGRVPASAGYQEGPDLLVGRPLLFEVRITSLYA
jgi:cyclophilin family peptidyl-prolyl cis-trans isomerase